MSTQLLDKVRYWSEHQCFDSETREHAKRMLQENNQKEIEECFKSVLESVSYTHLTLPTSYAV